VAGSGGLASRGHCKARKRVGVAGLALWRRVDGGAELAGIGKWGGGGVCRRWGLAGLFIG
jgi:hypothetical protein